MPERMPTAPLSELANFTMGQSPDSAHVNGEERGMPFLQGSAEFGARHPSARVHCFPPLRIAKTGSTLISVRAPVGTMNRADKDYCIGRGLAAIHAKAGIADDVFLASAIEQNISFLHRRSQGSTFLAIGSTDLSSMPVAAPALPQQQRIAEILSTVDEAIEQTEALITKAQWIKAGLMHDLFTRGVNADGQLRPPREEAPQLYKESPLGWIPKEWEPTLLGREIGIGHGFAFPGDGFFDVPPGEVLLTPGNFHRDGGLYFTANNTKYFRGYIPDGTVLVPGELVTVMTDLSPQTLILGRFAVVDTDYPVMHNQRIGLVRLRDEKRWNRRFLVAALNQDRIRREIIVGATGTTVRHTSPNRILGVHFARPSLEEQHRCAHIAAAVESQLDEEFATLRKLERTKTGLMQDLLTGRVSVGVETTSNGTGVAAHV